MLCSAVGRADPRVGMVSVRNEMLQPYTMDILRRGSSLSGSIVAWKEDGN